MPKDGIKLGRPKDGMYNIIFKQRNKVNKKINAK